MNKNVVAIIFVIGLIPIMHGCKRASNPAPSKLDDNLIADTLADGLNAEDDEFWANKSVQNPTHDEIFNPDGTFRYNSLDIDPAKKITVNKKTGTNTLNERANTSSYISFRNHILETMIEDVRVLSDKKNADPFPDEGVNKPSHAGYAYSSGQNDYNQRLQPTAGNTCHRQYFVYGTDCSGLM